MDTQDIPVLTEVYQSKPIKSSKAAAELSKEEINALIESVKPKIEAELTKKLTQELTEKISAKLQSELSTSLRKEMQEELKKTNQSKMSEKPATDSKATAKAIEDEVSKKLLAELTKQMQSMMDASKTELQVTQERLSKENAERVNLDIAGKISGMQELAVSQVKSQIANNMASQEDGFKQAVQNIVKETETSFSVQVDQQQAALTQFLTQQTDAFVTTALAPQKQQALEDFTQFCKEEIKKSKASFSVSGQAVSQELINVVTLYSKKLTEESQAKLLSTQEAFLTEATTHIQSKVQQDLNAQLESTIKQFNESLEAKSKSTMTEFKDSLDVNLPDVQKLLSEKLAKMLDKELPKFEKAIMSKIKSEINETLQSVKLVLPK